MKNSITPLEDLRKEKAAIKQDCALAEERLAAQWLYMKDNAGSLIFNSILSSVLHSLGFGGPSKSEEKNISRVSSNRGGTIGFIQNMFSGVSAYYPLIWEIVQPMLLAFAAKKIKSIFTRKKKKKRKYDDD